MAVTNTLYNHTTKLFANGDVDITGLKVILTNGYTFDATETALTAILAAEVSGNGWDAGGEPVAGEVVSIVTTNDAKLDMDDVSVTATGGAIGPATGAALVDATNSKPLAYIAFGETKQADVGTPFLVVWNASGVITWTYT